MVVLRISERLYAKCLINSIHTIISMNSSQTRLSKGAVQ